MLPRMRACVLVSALLGLTVASVSAQTTPVRVGPGVTAPRLLRHAEPEYSTLALANQVQGTVGQIADREKSHLSAPQQKRIDALSRQFAGNLN